MHFIIMIAMIMIIIINMVIIFIIINCIENLPSAVKDKLTFANCSLKPALIMAFEHVCVLVLGIHTVSDGVLID